MMKNLTIERILWKLHVVRQIPVSKGSQFKSGRSCAESQGHWQQSGWSGTMAAFQANVNSHGSKWVVGFDPLESPFQSLDRPICLWDSLQLTAFETTLDTTPSIWYSLYHIDHISVALDFEPSKLELILGLQLGIPKVVLSIVLSDRLFSLRPENLD